jgi:UTP:GlnB (protein PII) uridylyltransferase
MSWATFIKAHLGVVVGMDFFTAEAVTWLGLVRYHVLFAIDTEDKPGVLCTITHTLAEQGIDIQRSRVGVAADRVADIFHVRDSATQDKIEDEARIAVLSQALKRALAGLRS